MPLWPKPPLRPGFNGLGLTAHIQSDVTRWLASGRQQVSDLLDEPTRSVPSVNSADGRLLRYSGSRPNRHPGTSNRAPDFC